MAGTVPLLMANLLTAKASQVSARGIGRGCRRGRGSRPHRKLVFGGSRAPAVSGDEVVEVLCDPRFLEFLVHFVGDGFLRL